MTQPETSNAYLSEHDTFVQAGHQCRAGRWWHAQSADKSQAAIQDLVDRMMQHLRDCKGSPVDLREVLAERLKATGHG